MCVASCIIEVPDARSRLTGYIASVGVARASVGVMRTSDGVVGTSDGVVGTFPDVMTQLVSKHTVRKRR